MDSKNNSISSYYKDLRKLESLDSDKQLALVAKAKAGDKKALKKLVESNLKFVVSIAREYITTCSIPLEDLISEGNYGLVKSVKRFDEKRGIKFISYAVWWIRQAIQQSIYDNASIVRVPINKITVKKKINKAKEVLYKSLDREPTESEISVYLNISERDVKNGDINVNSSLDLKITNKNDEADSCDIFDILPGDGAESVERNMHKKDMLNGLDEVFSTLNKREKKIIKMYFGFENGVEMNLREIGAELNLTNERVRQIKDFALKKLRVYESSLKIKEFFSN